MVQRGPQTWSSGTFQHLGVPTPAQPSGLLIGPNPPEGTGGLRPVFQMSKRGSERPGPVLGHSDTDPGSAPRLCSVLGPRPPEGRGGGWARPKAGPHESHAETRRLRGPRRRPGGSGRTPLGEDTVSCPQPRRAPWEAAPRECADGGARGGQGRAQGSAHPRGTSGYVAER